MKWLKIMEHRALICPVCQSNKSEMIGKKVKLSGQFEEKEFLSTPLTVLRCVKCGFYMFFDDTAEFTSQEIG